MNHASRNFWELYWQLPPAVRDLADKNYRLFEENPRHRSLRFKRVDNRYWTVRIGRDYRAVGVDADDGIVWIWIGPHDEYETFIQS